MHRTPSVALASLLLVSAPISAQLSKPEQQLVAVVDDHNEAALALLEQVVNINSGTRNLTGVREVGTVFRVILDSLGFETTWVDGSGFDRAGHLVAEHPGPGPKILLIGHLDTVFEPDSPFQRFERVNDSTARGPGIIDMKGGNVIIVEALGALREVGLLDDLNITIVFTGDEEAAGRPLRLARAALKEAAEGAAFAIGLENGDGDPATVVVARRGSTGWRLRTTGTAGHASQIFREDIGVGATYEAARILNSFYEELAGEQYLAFSPGLIVGGSELALNDAGTEATVSGKSNVISREVVVTGDIRTISTEQLNRAQDAMREIVSQHLPHTDAEITFDEGYPPLAPSRGNRQLLGFYDEVSRDLGTGAVTAVDPSRAGAADVAFIAGLVPMIIDGVGLSGVNDHSAEETADLRMLPVQTKRLAILLSRLGESTTP